MSAEALEQQDTSRAVRDDFEAYVRGLVADHLGVAPDDLRHDVSLVDHLAADSLDLVELALAIEANLGVVLPRHFLDEIRTCGQLIHATVTLAKRRRRSARRAGDDAVALRARLTPGSGERPWTIERVLMLTPYAAESLAEDALRAGAGARLELSLAARTTDAALVRIREYFSRLVARGIAIEIRRDGTRQHPSQDDAA